MVQTNMYSDILLILIFGLALEKKTRGNLEIIIVICLFDRRLFFNEGQLQ